MRQLWPTITNWLESGEPFALATVIHVSGSTPRAPGACMIIQPATSRFTGSVSSGCLDNEVIETAKSVLDQGQCQFLRFGPDGIQPWSDGLTCGGWVEIRVEPWWSFSQEPPTQAIASVVQQWMETENEGLILSKGDHHLAISSEGTLTGEADSFDSEMISHARLHLAQERPPASFPAPDGSKVFFRTLRRRPQLILIGAVEASTHLVPFAKLAGWAVTVIDPRAAYAKEERFKSSPDRLIREWPHTAIPSISSGPRDALLTLSHDSKIDDPALLAALDSKFGYIGALGSSRSHKLRCERLRELGVPEVSIKRIHGPAGIHLGHPTPEGIAAGIFAGLLQWEAERERLSHVTEIKYTG